MIKIVKSKQKKPKTQHFNVALNLHCKNVKRKYVTHSHIIIIILFIIIMDILDCQNVQHFKEIIAFDH